jgi:hypothetical protein
MCLCFVHAGAAAAAGTKEQPQSADGLTAKERRALKRANINTGVPPTAAAAAAPAVAALAAAASADSAMDVVADSSEQQSAEVPVAAAVEGDSSCSMTAKERRLAKRAAARVEAQQCTNLDYCSKIIINHHLVEVCL